MNDYCQSVAFRSETSLSAKTGQVPHHFMFSNTAPASQTPEDMTDVIHLPNGHRLSVQPVFGGLFFKPNDLNVHSAVFPKGWTIILQSEELVDARHSAEGPSAQVVEGKSTPKKLHIHKFSKPTLQNDCLFISSISFPSTDEFKAPASPTRQIAMMLWATLYWYFHQTEPSPFVTTEASKYTPDNGKPKADWRIKIKREGVFRGRNLLPKLERMGLIYSENSAVGASSDNTEGWEEMFTSRRAFWQLSPRIFLFTLSPNANPLSIPGSPYGSPVGSPSHSQTMFEHGSTDLHGFTTSPGPQTLLGQPLLPDPYASGSHLPTYYPPPPLQYINTNGVRHPMRPKPPQQGETFYTRYISSLGEQLSFRVASLSDKPVVYNGLESSSSVGVIHSPSSPHTHTPAPEGTDTRQMTDVQLIHKWMNDPRVSKSWGCDGPIETQEKFLRGNLESKHSFPVIGCWNGRPFGYFELYWVKEDLLGRILNAGEAKDWDRGVHVVVGEQEFRGAHRLSRWISAFVHYALTADYRTECLVLEPRIDNERFIRQLEDNGFTREKQVVFPHKTSWYMRYKRETFDGPAL
ncbi:hypothetical protein VF21_06882 [Pseudogymnoascus sp. 05NY08]|nr:hypothetical protein VF21_06882 [Pseudogymnoascus sp. 05NY08]